MEEGCAEWFAEGMHLWARQSDKHPEPVDDACHVSASPALIAPNLCPSLSSQYRMPAILGANCPMQQHTES